jgi:DNA invertase Pin-like site-specific DNA recombinase
MSEGRFIAYFRVSTAEQGRSGLGLEAQRAAVETYLNGGCWTLLGAFTEVESGKVNARPQLAAAMAQCRLTGATLVIAKLDRLSRNVAFLANLMEADVEFRACDNPHATRFNLHILAAVAEFEREQIAKRTKDALAAAKARGTKLGGWRPFRRNGTARAPAGDPKKATAGLRHQADAFAARVQPTLAELRAAGMSLEAVAAELGRRGILTSRGGTAWTATTVRRVLARA